MVAKSSPEQPMPVRTASRLLGDWIRRTGAIWVEGQISQLRRRGSTAWITLRDTDADMAVVATTDVERASASRAASSDESATVTGQDAALEVAR